MLTPSLLLSAIVLTAITLVPIAPSGAGLQDAAAPATTKANPVKQTAESQTKAKKQYGYECEMCHGTTGDGKTDLAKDMKMSLTDLSDAKTLAGKTDGELFDLIKNGKGPMAAEGNRMKPDEIWNLVIYTRGLSKK